MNLDQLSIVICRAAGLILLILGFSYLLPALFRSPYSGWTSYAPMSKLPEIPLSVILVQKLRGSLPAIIQMAGGAILLVGGRSLGVLWTRGLIDRVHQG